jgi:hypothetical protein
VGGRWRLRGAFSGGPYLPLVSGSHETGGVAARARLFLPRKCFQRHCPSRGGDCGDFRAPASPRRSLTARRFAAAGVTFRFGWYLVAVCERHPGGIFREGARWRPPLVGCWYSFGVTVSERWGWGVGARAALARCSHERPSWQFPATPRPQPSVAGAVALPQMHGAPGAR